jgi:hypothetical protein
MEVPSALLKSDLLDRRELAVLQPLVVLGNHPQPLRLDGLAAVRMQIIPAQHRDASIRRNGEVEIESRP